MYIITHRNGRNALISGDIQKQRHAASIGDGFAGTGGTGFGALPVIPCERTGLQPGMMNGDRSGEWGTIDGHKGGILMAYLCMYHGCEEASRKVPDSWAVECSSCKDGKTYHSSCCAKHQEEEHNGSGFCIPKAVGVFPREAEAHMEQSV